MKFDFIFGSPPFQDNKNRGKTQHKLWLEFTTKWFADGLDGSGEIVWITPSSWGSPSSKILQLFKDNQVKKIDLDINNYFPGIGSTFSYYHVKKGDDGAATLVRKSKKDFTLEINESVKYFPNDFCDESISIHKKVMFDPKDKISLQYDYVTCHNVIRHRKKNINKKIEELEGKINNTTCEKLLTRRQNSLASWRERLEKCVITISEVKTKEHVYPVFHTNNKVWYSSIKQDFLEHKKVMWYR